ncbi:MAG: hypothetical protein JWQ83_414 [Lacunisphaera sp.]|nr:hypothetical protein [Lacunisphaera sp.]MDB6165274.1 hypothetical protein [Lacunisphaera sp.]
MLFLNKLLPVFVLPLGLIALLLLFGWWRKKRWPVAVALGVLYSSSIPWFANHLMRWVEMHNPPVAVAQIGAADAVIVLGGILGPKTEPGFIPNFSDTSERFEAGVALLAAGKAGNLIFTGAKTGWAGSTLTEGDELKRLAIAHGISAERIFVTSWVRNTADEAGAVAALMREQHWHSIILVTSAWHMPRAAYQFKRAGVNCAIFPVDFRGDTTRKVTVIDFVPRADAWQMTDTALRETYGYWFYRVFR